MIPDIAVRHLLHIPNRFPFHIESLIAMLTVKHHTPKIFMFPFLLLFLQLDQTPF